ncbi:MAG: PQQ-binding-like beta-propeller repeat protein [Acidobacteria bacterium]|nr:PQQ-binding-like beta-propeller repeat protein [Acidobacteriota bacterium]
MKGPLVVLALLLASGGGAADWPQWRGPARDGRITDLQTRAAWPEALAPAWKVTVGEGHASPVVAGDHVYVFSREGEDEVVRALELASGQTIWRQAYPAPYEMNPAAHAHGKGPKGTPVVADGRVCTLGISGILSCWDAGDGRPLWRKEFASQFSATSPLYGTAMSPVVDGGRVIAHVGGPGDGALTAFDAATGEVAWSWTGDGPGYASPVVAEIGGARQVVTFSESFLVGVSADDGTLLWQLPFTTSWVQNAVTPIVQGDTVIYSGLDHPVQAVKVTTKDGRWTTTPAWENDAVACYMSTPVLADGRIFGFSQRKHGQFFALDAASGETVWLSGGRQGDNAAVLAGGGVLFLLTNEATLIVAPQAGEAFAPKRTWPVAGSPTWAHPVVLDEGVLVKDVETLALLRFEGGTGAAGIVAPPPAGERETTGAVARSPAGETGAADAVAPAPAGERETTGAVARSPEKGAEMSWIWFVVGAVLSWGLYGPVLHKGQMALGNPLKAFLFVGFAYFLVGVLVPLASLASQGQLKGFTTAGMMTSTWAGVLGALGAVCVIYAFRAGGAPLWVMPLVFAGAPIVNVLYSMWQHPPKAAPSPMLYVGFLMAAAGAYMVLHYKPQG